MAQMESHVISLNEWESNYEDYCWKYVDLEDAKDEVYDDSTE
jgi:hypothetical protein